MRGQALEPAAEFLRKHHLSLLTRLTRWSALDEEEVRALLTKLEQRAEALGLEFRGRHLAAKLMDVTALATALAMDFAHTGRFTG